MSQQNLSQAERTLQRGIHPWMSSVIALGGIVGSCYFLGSGELVATLGVSTVFAFMIGGVIIWIVMQSFAELLVNLPRQGSFVSYSKEFLHPYWGCGNGWSYWFSMATYFPSEAVAAGIIMKSLFGDLPGIGDISPFIWAVIFLILITIINIAHVENFGKIESTLALIVIGSLFVYVVVAILLITGVVGEGVGTSVIFPEGKPTYEGLFPAGWVALITYIAVILVNFTGSEIIGLAAAETQNPEKTVPKACKQVVYRIIMIYVIPIACLVCLLPHTDSGLEGSMFAASLSKYAVAFNIPWLGYIAAGFTVVVLTAAFSCSCASVFGTVRSMYAMSLEGYAPKIFGELNKNGVPQKATIATLIFGWVMLLLQAFFEDSSFYMVLISIAGVTGSVTWGSICLSAVSFRHKAYKNGYKKSDIKAPIPGYPIVPMIAPILMAVGISFMSFTGETYLVVAFFAAAACVLGPLAAYVICVKKGKRVTTRELKPGEMAFEKAFPDKRQNN